MKILLYPFDKYVGVVFEETSDKIVVISDESESRDRFEIPKCKIIMATISSTGNRMILDWSMQTF